MYQEMLVFGPFLTFSWHIQFKLPSSVTNPRHSDLCHLESKVLFHWYRPVRMGTILPERRHPSTRPCIHPIFLFSQWIFGAAGCSPTVGKEGSVLSVM